VLVWTVPVVQQKTVDPALPGTPVLQFSDGSAAWGVSEPVHENPYEPATQLVTVLSSAHDVVAVNDTQQKSTVDPLSTP
jgi:hypothetical protein